MTITAIQHLCRTPDVTLTVVFHSGNQQFHDKLRNIKSISGNLDLVSLDFHSKNLQALRSLISWRKIGYLQGLMKQIHPDVVVVAQGRIEGCSMGLVAAKRAGFRTISYLPMAHAVSVSGRPCAVGLRERINRYFYNLPDEFITINQSARRMLRERGATPNVVVVRNAVEIRPIGELDRQRFREGNGIRGRDYAVAIIGRIQFKQKGQDFALRAINSFRNELRDWRFVFVGEGPDKKRLQAMISRLNLSSQVQLAPWTPNPTDIYAGSDMLLIPSRFEGVPLVMLEAMAYRLPIVATNVDGMAEFLPSEWLFSFGDQKGLIDTLLRVRIRNNSDDLDLNRNQVLQEFTPERFSAEFSSAVFG